MSHPDPKDDPDNRHLEDSPFMTGIRRGEQMKKADQEKAREQIDPDQIKTNLFGKDTRNAVESALDESKDHDKKWDEKKQLDVEDDPDEESFPEGSLVEGQILQIFKVKLSTEEDYSFVKAFNTKEACEKYFNGLDQSIKMGPTGVSGETGSPPYHVVYVDLDDRVLAYAMYSSLQFIATQIWDRRKDDKPS